MCACKVMMLYFLYQYVQKDFNVWPCDSHVTSISRRSWDIMFAIKIKYTYSFIVVIYYKSHIFIKIPDPTNAYMYSRLMYTTTPNITHQSSSLVGLISNYKITEQEMNKMAIHSHVIFRPRDAMFSLSAMMTSFLSFMVNSAQLNAPSPWMGRPTYIVPGMVFTVLSRE